MTWQMIQAECVEAMGKMESESVDAIVTDPPYGINFMGKEWDSLGNDNQAFQVWCQTWATEALRVLKPGGHLLAFGGTRTYHRLACGIEDAGFEVRDSLAFLWCYGTGFPKSHNLKGDKEGWGTALKPAHEPIVMGRKPLAGTVAANVEKHGTGALNVDGCRVGTDGGTRKAEPAKRGSVNAYGDGLNGGGVMPIGDGRWPANLVLDESTAALMGDSARFFYCPKSSRAERDAGLDGFEERSGGIKNDSGRGFSESDPYREIKVRNHHPTVKPIDLMRWLVRLVTPPGGTVLDPFTGSGTTGIAAGLEGFDFIGIEREADYLEIARARLRWWEAQPQQTSLPIEGAA